MKMRSRRAGRRAHLRDQAIQFFDVSLRHITRPFGTVVDHRNRDHSALAIFLDRGSLRQSLARILFVAIPINFLQIESVDEVIFHGAAANQFDKQRAFVAHAEKISRQRWSPEDTFRPATAAASRKKR